MTDILFSPGRMVQGSLHEGRTKDQSGAPLMDKNGQPKTQYFFGYAIPKNAGETHWSQTPWGAIIYNEAVVGFPNGEHARPNFSWKVVDGDSPELDENGKPWNSKEGFPGNWVVKVSSGFLPHVVNSEPPYLPHPNPASIKRGHWIELAATVKSNANQQKPGVYINPSIVRFVGFGEEISSGPDASSVGFGQAPMPAGVTQAPAAGMGVAPAAMPAPMAAPVVPAGAPAPAVAMPAPMAAPVAAPAPAPNPAILQAPGAAPVAAPAAPARVMLAPANGASYEELIAAGWTNETLVQHGMMQA